jgi:hypothetical protein
MKQHKLKYPVELMCKVLNTSKSGYYNWLSSGPSKRWNENQEIMQVIHLILKIVIKAMVHQEWLLNLKNVVLKYPDPEQQE